MKHAEAARILDLADAPPRRSTSAVALALAILTIAGIFWFAAHEVSARGSLHSAHQAGSLSRSTEFGRKTTAMESDKMKKLISIGVVSTAISASAMAQNAVQWRVEDGGNGHWYAGAMPTGVAISWSFARDECLLQGGYLACISSAAENGFVAQVVASPDLWTIDIPYCIGPWLGGFQPPDAVEPAGGWSWVSGDAWGFQNWWLPAQEPNDGCGGEDYLHFLTQGATTPSDWWNDRGAQLCPPGPKSFVAEWEADCNNDGIVDYGQIRAGEYEDLNANNIPDCCEYSTPCDCDADIIQDNAINGVDLAAIMNAWGTDGGKIPRCDVDGSGIVDGSDLTIVLDAWGPCP